MITVCLLAVLVVARALTLIGRDLDWSVWSPAAYLWQDCLVVVAFAGLERLAGKRRAAVWVVYAAACLYVAVNVPVARMMSTPLTWAMLRGARGALGDSISHQVTLGAIAAVGAVVAAAMAAPLALRKLKGSGIIFGAAAVAVVGSLTSHRVDTLGRHRNALVVLVSSAFPRIEASGGEADWRRSPMGEQSPGTDLSWLSGAGAGRNVVVVILESTGAAYLRPWGAEEDAMPNVSRLAEECSVAFDQAYTVYPESIKGLLATFCSRYPAMDTAAETYAGKGGPSIADVLAARGYRTGLFHSGRFMYLGMEALVRGRGFATLEDAGDIGGRRESSFGVDEESTVRRVLSWVDEGRRTPFLAVFMPIAGHHPYDSPPGGPFDESTEVGRYRNALRYSDKAVGMLVDGLKQRGEYEDTVFIMFGDHGEAFGEHDGNFGHTNFIYEENARIPYLIAMPGLVRGEVRSATVMSTVDTAPTVLDLLGVEAPAGWQGGSGLKADPRMGLFFTDYSLGLLGLRDGKWKFILEVETGRGRLFDLAGDPAERRDVSASEASRVAAYRQHLLKWASAARADAIR